MIAYEVGAPGPASLRVYDVLGREVRRLADGMHAPGRYEVAFDGSGLPIGVYVCRLDVGGQALTRRMVVVR